MLGHSTRGFYACYQSSASPLRSRFESRCSICRRRCDAGHFSAARDGKSACLLAFCALAHSPHGVPGVVLGHVCKILHTVQIDRRQLPRWQRVQWCGGAEPAAGPRLGRVRHRGRTGQEFRPADQRSTAGELVTTALAVQNPLLAQVFPLILPAFVPGFFSRDAACWRVSTLMAVSPFAAIPFHAKMVVFDRKIASHYESL